MLIGPQNLAVQVNHVRSRINRAAEAAGRDPASVTLVAVTKAKPAELVRAAATAGVTDFGENYLQEALGKMDELAALPVHWHFIGAVQSNKTRAIAERFEWVHSVDRLSVGPAPVGTAAFSRACRSTCAFRWPWCRSRPRAASSRQTSPSWRGAPPELPRLRLRGLMCMPPPQPVAPSGAGGVLPLEAPARGP